MSDPTAAELAVAVEALEAIVRFGQENPRRYDFDPEYRAVIRTAELGLAAARRRRTAVGHAAARRRAMDGRTEEEARAAFPPNCPRCTWVPPIGLLRCLSCALTAMAANR